MQDFARGDVEKQLQSGAAGCAAVMAALSGHQLGSAAALAAASGDVRLATLLAQVQQSGSCHSASAVPYAQVLTLGGYCTGKAQGRAGLLNPEMLQANTSTRPWYTQAGKRGTSTADIEAQLQTWEEAGMVPHIDPTRLQVYQVLGGQLDLVLPSLQLPWRLALGMHLW